MMGTSLRVTFFTMIAFVLMSISGCGSSGAPPPGAALAPVSTPSPSVDLCADVRVQLEKSLQNCQTLNNNKVCYGDKLLDAVPDDHRFRLPSDRIPFFDSNVKQVAVRERDDLAAGIIVLYLSVGEDVPVRIVSIGSVELSPTANLQSFALRWADEAQDYVCEATPPGIMVQTDEGQEVSLTLNNMELTLGSTAYIAMESPQQFRVANFAGDVAVEGKEIGQGQEVPVEIDGERVTVGAESASNLLQSPMLTWLATEETALARITNLNADPRTSCNRPLIDPAAEGVTLPFEEQLSTYAPGHACEISFCLDAVEFVTMQVDTLDARFNPAIDLRDADGGYVTHNNATAPDNSNAIMCNQQLSAGCYTASAHSFRYQSWGAFETSIVTGVQNCNPDIFCDVTAVEGLNFRTGPALDEKVIRALARGTQVLSLKTTSSDGLWEKVRVIGPDYDETGWLWANDYSLVCPDGPSITPTPTPTKDLPDQPTLVPPPRPPTRTPIPPVPTKEAPIEDPFG